MSYSPNNEPEFLTAFAGALSGIGVAGRPILSTDSGDYSGSAASAFAFAIEFDTLWGATSPDCYQLTAIGLACQGYWRNRSVTSVKPSDYATECAALVTAIQEGESLLVAEGLDIPDCCCEGSGTQGPQGAQGAQGSQGAQGAQGPQGAQGGAGAQGGTGAQGAQGTQGTQGSQGAQGASNITPTGTGYAHVTAGVLDAAAAHGAQAGEVPVTNAGITDAPFGFIFGVWTATVNNAASPYSPTAGQVMIAVDTSTGAVTINTPATPTDGQIFFIKPVTASATPITVAGTAGATVENPSNAGNFGATGQIPGQGGGVGFKYQAAGTRWIGFTGF